MPSRSSPWILCALLAGCAVATPENGSGGPDAGADRARPDAAQGADADPAAPDPEGPSEACASALDALGEDFESGAEGWTHRSTISSSVEWPFDEWELGAAGGTGCRGGTGCFGTALGGNYAQCGRAELLSPPLDLSACAGEEVSVILHHTHDFWTGSYGDATWSDGGVIEISGDGQSWRVPEAPAPPATLAINPDQGAAYACVQSEAFYVDGMPGYAGSTGGWERLEIPVPEELLTAEFQIRFRYASGVSSQTTDADQSRAATGAGWYIDDLSFEGR